MLFFKQSSRWKQKTVALLTFALLAATPATEQASARNAINPSYQEVEAAFIFNFSLFTTWSPESFESASSPINIGILKDKNFAEILVSVIGANTAKGRSFVIKSSDSIDNLKNSHIVFIGSKTATLDDDIRRLKSANTLTISSSPGFAKKGVIINFYKSSDKIRFEINLEAAKEAGLQISSKVLQLAKIVATSERSKR